MLFVGQIWPVLQKLAEDKARAMARPTKALTMIIAKLSCNSCLCLGIIAATVSPAQIARNCAR